MSIRVAKPATVQIRIFPRLYTINAKYLIMLGKTNRNIELQNCAQLIINLKINLYSTWASIRET